MKINVVTLWQHIYQPTIIDGYTLIETEDITKFINDQARAREQNG